MNYTLRNTLLLALGTSMLCTPALRAETLYYRKGEPVRTTVTHDEKYENPYQQRRVATAQDGAPAPVALPSPSLLNKTANALLNPSPPSSRKTVAEAPRAPMRIIIPNIETTKPASQPVETDKPQMVREIPEPAATSQADTPSLPSGEIQTRAVAATASTRPLTPLSATEIPAESTAETADAADRPTELLLSESEALPAPAAPAGEESAAAKTNQIRTPAIDIRHEKLAMLTPQPTPQNIEKLAALSPAAGGDATADAPLISPPAATAPNPPGMADNIPPVEPLLGKTAPENAPANDLAAPLPALEGVEPPQLPVSQKPAAAISEPPPTLSPKSSAILKKIPSHLDSSKKSAAGTITIERSKDTASETKPADSAASVQAPVKHESLEAKIDVKAKPLDVNYDLERAYNATIAGNNAEAISLYRRALANEPENKNALFGLATTYHRAGQLEQARPLYGRLLSIDPRNRDALNNFLVLISDEAPGEALSKLADLEKRNPEFSPIPAQMAVIYQKLGQFDQAAEKMYAAVNLAPENLTYRYNLAILLDKQKKYDEAGKLYRQLLEAYRRGEPLPGDALKIQQRLTFISSNRP